MQIREGDEAPDFEAKDTQGNDLKLSSFRGKKNVVLFFYPRAFTSGCTAEVCSFRDAYEDLVGKDVELIGVSTDALEKQGKFAERYKLPYPLIGDEKHVVSDKYGVIGMFRSLLNITRRVTFVIDKKGVVRGVFHHELSIDSHLRDVKNTLASLPA